MAVHWCAGGNFTINILPQQPLFCDRIHHQRHSEEMFAFASVWSCMSDNALFLFVKYISASWLWHFAIEMMVADLLISNIARLPFVRRKAWSLLHLNSLKVTFTLHNYSRDNVRPRFLQRSPARRQTLSPCSLLLLLASRSSPLLLRWVHNYDLSLLLQVKAHPHDI